MSVAILYITMPKVYWKAHDIEQTGREKEELGDIIEGKYKVVKGLMF